MFREKTVLVLGAGASHPYGYPTGQGLIRELLDNSETQDLADTRRAAGYDDSQLMAFKNALEKAAFWSIDAFLEHRAEQFGGVGKFLLAQRLLKKEAPALFYRDANGWYDDNWYPMLLNAIAPSPAAVADNQLTIINFNYDRSVKAYLFTAIKERFNWLDTKVAEVVESIPFIHVHGHLGPLQWQPGGSNDSAYGNGLTLEKVKKAAEGIKIIHEANGSTSEFIAAQKALQEARYIFFLGFGYHKANMERLGMPIRSTAKTNTIEGTGFGFTNAERNQILRQYQGIAFGADQFKISQFIRNSENFLRASEGY